MIAMTTSIETYPYQNAKLPIAERVRDLLSRMTLEEKASQMVCIWNKKAEMLLDEQGNFDEAKARDHFGHGNGLGQVGRPSDSGGGKNPRAMAELTNAIQRFFVENSRLGIPIIFHEECLHGHAGIDATSFSQPIGLGATFDPNLIERLFAMTAAEVRARGAQQALTPVVDVARDPRWGRVEETYGEDPYLNGVLGVAAVKGFQGDGKFKDKKHVIATLKHFAAHGQPEAGNNCAPVSISERHLRETFFATFKKALEEGGAISVMASYNEIDGVPSHASRWLLRDVLRKEWGFQGFVVSDYYAIRELAERPELYGHHVARDGKEAAYLAVKAGVNIELPEPDCYNHLVELVQEGMLEEADLDELVAPMLEYKFKLGMFESPYTDPDLAETLVGCKEHEQLALEAARKTITLLKNEARVAPLDPNKQQTLAVIGPNADRVLLGGYSGKPKHVSTVLEGIRNRVGNSAKVLHHEGCKITVGGGWWIDEVVPSDPAEDRRSIAEAVEVARQADVIVLAVGGNEQTSREAWMGNHLGDRTSLDLFGRQDELVDALAELDKPIIALVFGGRPLSIGNLNDKVDTIFQCWYMGQATGEAVAEAIFGDINPGGKLPISIPRSVGHIPVYYNYRPSARRGYLLDDVSALFPFGFGLSYTQFQISEPRLAKTVIGPHESTDVSVEITNVGDAVGDEVVQMYIRDRVSSVTRPVKELKGFQRVTLQPGETYKVKLSITRESLAFFNIDRDYTIEPGEFEIMVGSSSRTEDLQTVVLTVT
jgi:beta-glucosidase